MPSTAIAVFGAAAMKSLNNLLFLGYGETWARQRIDFTGLPEMVRTFLQVAAGAADIPVTRLLGQSPAGLSATGDSDIRNYYDMIAARQEIDLRPQLERLDRLLMASAGVAPGTLSFSFRPLWQMDAATKAATALQKAQATVIYAGLGLWPKPVMAGLVAGQLAEDGIYPDAGAAFEAEAETEGSPPPVRDYSPDQPRDPQGRWTEGANGSSSFKGSPQERWNKTSAGHLTALNSIGSAEAHEADQPPENRSQNNNARVLISQASSGPLTPGGVIGRPVAGTDPLDPANLNIVPPTTHQQEALVATLNLIQEGETDGLNPHSYQNRPHSITGAVLPPTVGGYMTYDVSLGGPNRGSSRVIIDSATQKIYYTNNHYRSFFPITMAPIP